MDKLEAVRLAALKLDQAADEELLARTAETKSAARARMIDAEREYVWALDVLHEAPRTTGNDDDAQAQADFAGTG